ncbi:MAG: hypothetical protein ACREQ9_02970, partial [Candidatus Binatia bacterium]
MLVGRDGPGDRTQAATLAAEGLRAAREIGMKPLEAKVRELIEAAGLGEIESAAPLAAASTFRQEGDFWAIGYDGTWLRLKDSKGLQYIAYLIRNQGREIHATEIAAGSEARDERADLGDAGEILDPQA